MYNNISRFIKKKESDKDAYNSVEFNDFLSTSIFIADTVQRVSPAVTCCPTATKTFSTAPGIGDPTDEVSPETAIGPAKTNFPVLSLTSIS